jgi:hypothetical protein
MAQVLSAASAGRKAAPERSFLMTKKVLSLLITLAISIVLLTVTALADDYAPPETLYVGGTEITDGGCWTTDTDGKLTKCTETGDNWNVKYEKSSGTLTLHNATIKGDDSGSYKTGPGIYAVSSNDSNLTLNILLEGDNTVTGKSGIYVEANKDTALKITGSGSLTATGTSSGIHLYSNSGNISLTIEGADVIASSSNNSSESVYIISYSTNNDSLAINIVVTGGSFKADNGIMIICYITVVDTSTPNPPNINLTVSDSAIVRCLHISDSVDTGESLEIISVNFNYGGQGIIFDGNDGTVYGDVTLQDDLTINEGETLTIGEGTSLTVPEGKTLTNNGTVTTENGGSLNNQGTINNINGTLPETINGKTPPSISVQPQNKEVAAGEEAEFSVEASGDTSEKLTYQWQQSTDSGSDWTDISGATDTSYTINSTTTSMSGCQYRCVVTGSGSGVSVISSAATLTVTQPVTGVTLDKATLELFTGGSATLAATIEPSDATKKNATWQSNNANVATVQNGTVTAVGPGEATIAVTTEDGKRTATCTVTVTDPIYGISAAPTELNFGSVYTGYARPDAQTVTITNTGNQPLTLVQPESTGCFEVGELSDTSLPVNGAVTFTVQPKAGLASGIYSEDIELSGSGGAAITVTASFTVRQHIVVPTIPPETPDEPDVTAPPFTDVAASAWYYDSVAYVCAEGLMEGVSEDRFDPDGGMTCAMLWAILARIDGETVTGSAWAEDARRWALDSGVSDGTDADGFVTREQLVTMLWRFMGEPTVDFLLTAEDAGDISAWAYEAMRWAVSEGIIEGSGSGRLEPDAGATRAQTAAILMRCLEK